MQKAHKLKDMPFYKKLNTFFKSNAVRAGLVFFVIFMTIPFFFAEPPQPVAEEDDVFLSTPVAITTNPLSKFFGRIGNFYGITKGPKSTVSVAGKAGSVEKAPVSDLRGLVDKIYSSLTGRKNAEAKGDTSAGNEGSSYSGGDSDEGYQSAKASGKGQNRDISSMNRHKNQETEEFVRMNGKVYPVMKVMTDEGERKMVKMDNTYVPFEDLMARTVSKEDFDAAKKAAPQLKNWQITEGIRYANQNNYPGGPAAFLKSKDYASLSRNGTQSLFADSKGGSGGGSFSGGISDGAAGGGSITAGGKGGSSGLGGGSINYGGRYSAANPNTAKGDGKANANRSSGRSGAASSPITPAQAGPLFTLASIGTKAAQKVMFTQDNEKLVLIKSKEENNFIESEIMTRTLLCDDGGSCQYKVDIVEDNNGKPTDKVIEPGLKDRWILPKEGPTNTSYYTPAQTFYNENESVLLNSKYKDRTLWTNADYAADVIREDLRAKLYDTKTPVIPGDIKVAVLDSFEGGAFKSADPYFTDNVVISFIGGKAVNIADKDTGIVNLDNITADTLIFVFDKETAKNLRVNGLLAVAIDIEPKGKRDLSLKDKELQALLKQDTFAARTYDIIMNELSTLYKFGVPKDQEEKVLAFIEELRKGIS